MIIIKKAGALFCVLALQIFFNPVLADDTGSDKNRSWYIGGALGITELDPDTGNSGYNVSDKSDTGIKLFGGYDFTEQFTVEAFYVDLGAAKISSDFVTLPDGEITYTTMGASALWYFWRNGESGGSNLRKGWQAYVHGGVSFLNNSASSGINYTQDNSTQIQYGAALEYGLNNGIAFRAGLDLYDKDAGMAFVGVLKRFGTASKRKIVTEPVPEPEPEPQPIPVQSKEIIPAAVVVVDVDTDNDGVVDRLDECVNSPVEISVDEKGCSIVALEFEGVNFKKQAFELTKDSKLILDEAVITINTSPEFHKLMVQAHTDDKGTEKYNLKLSDKRAASVKEYLVSQGVNEDRLVAKGFGESRPIADNKTADGRAQNRRVEISVIKDDVTDVGMEQSAPKK